MDVFENVGHHRVARGLDGGNGVDHLDPVRQALGDFGALLVVVFQFEQVFPQLSLKLGVSLQIALHRGADAFELTFGSTLCLFHARSQKYLPVANVQALLGHLDRSGGHAHGVVDHPAQRGHGVVKGAAGKIHGRDAQENPH